MIKPTTGLSNNSFSPKAQFCNLMRTVMINDSILSPGLRLYVWHWSLQFWKDENNQIPLFLWSSSHFWCSFGFGTVSDFRIKTYLVHSDSCFQITRTRTSSKVSPLVVPSLSASNGCIGTPPRLWCVAPKPLILLVKFTCALTWLTCLFDFLLLLFPWTYILMTLL